MTRLVVIVGGGPSGLFLSQLLRRTVPHVLLEAQKPDQRFRHPQAHFLNTRTMELFRYHGIDVPMAPYEQWSSFQWGRNLKQSLVQVHHDVHLPLQAGRDANGRLTREEIVERKDLSPCTVGHVPQHTLGRLLYDTVQGDHIRFGERCVALERVGDEVVVHTDQDQSYHAWACVAADGAHSWVREQVGIPMHGQHSMQQLYNIHVRTDPFEEPTAMLHTSLTPDGVAMVVCHGAGEYTVQVPFHVPLSDDRIQALLDRIFEGFSYRVESQKIWTMSALVAERYVEDRCVLVGDAAHVFPPAGGLGMNTGLQDVHNLAWKLEWAYQQSSSVLPDVLKSYEKERRPIAMDNAALSVRNYQRLLKVLASIHLDANHPDLLQTVLQHSPLAQSTQDSIFTTLYDTALAPLRWLEDPDSRYTQHVRSRLEDVLRRGAGLPLLFPNSEVGVSYGRQSRNDSDTLAALPVLEQGRLLPHAQVRVLRGLASDMSTTTTTTTNLSAQLGTNDFVLLLVGDWSEIPDATEWLNGIRVSPVLLLPPNYDGPVPESMPTVLQEVAESHSAFSFTRDSPYAVLVRPDSHVAAISWDTAGLAEFPAAVRESLGLEQASDII